jgi:hypothetical protein
MYVQEVKKRRKKEEEAIIGSFASACHQFVVPANTAVEDLLLPDQGVLTRLPCLVNTP